MQTESIVRGLEKLGYATNVEHETDRIMVRGRRGSESICLEQARAIDGGPLHIRGGWIKDDGLLQVSFEKPKLKEVLEAAA